MQLSLINGLLDGFHTYAGSRASKVKIASVVLITLVQNIIVKLELGINTSGFRKNA
jgi:hypothetical protein